MPTPTMIARHETHTDKAAVWAKLAAKVAPDDIQWRQDGRPTARDGKWIARFVAYIDAQTVRDRLDAVVPGDWDLTLEQLPPRVTTEADDDEACAFKARLQILGVIRESVGQGKDYKQAETDAFKRAAVRFGIGHELYSFGHNWVQMDGDGKYAKPVEDPGVAYARRQGRPVVKPVADGGADIGVTTAALAPTRERGPAASGADEIPSTALPSDEPQCPKCGGRMWDNRLTKRNPKAPDFKCRDRACDGVLWPPKGKPATVQTAEEVEEIPF